MIVLSMSYCNRDRLEFDSNKVTRISMLYLSDDYGVIERDLNEEEKKQIIDIFNNLKISKVSSPDEKGGWTLKLRFYDSENKIYSSTQGDNIFEFNSQYYDIDKQSNLSFTKFKDDINEKIIKSN